MGGHKGRAHSADFLPNGLLSNEVASVTQVLDLERWSLAEERTAELIACIQPNQFSEQHRNAVANYVQNLIMKCFPCQVFTFGSVPLKTYLPDGDIDLTAFTENQSLKDSWVKEVLNILESEEKNENAEFHVKEVHYIQAEVKIIKCLVENIVVDISFNQLGGLCTLCFLEEVDNLISKNHLFKRSIILIKAWCYYESRILGAHHGLISTYALETLVLYIFHVFNNSFAGPLEVLHRFLEFFSKFDWDNFCVSLSGPVPISSLPDMTADSPRKDDGEILLSKMFLDACSSVYSVLPGGQENMEQSFICKHFNVIDPLRTNNNLGRSVSKGNFYRIRSAFAFGARRLAKLLDCPKENLIAEINQFFMNTLDRHGNGHRPDVPDIYNMQLVYFDEPDGSESFRNHLSNKHGKENSNCLESVVEVTRVSHRSNVSPFLHDDASFKQLSRPDHVSGVSHTETQKTNAGLNGSITADKRQQKLQNDSNGTGNTHKGKGSRPGFSRNEQHAIFHLARTQSSPDLSLNEAPYKGRHDRVVTPGISDNSRRRDRGPELLDNHGTRFSTKNSPSSLSGASVNYHHSVAETMQMHQEEQDLVNMKAFRSYNSTGQVPVSVNVTSVLPCHSNPLSVSVGYTQKNLAAMMPADILSFESNWDRNMHYSQGLMHLPVCQYLPSVGVASDQEEMDGLVDGSLLSTEPNQVGGHNGFWSAQSVMSVRSGECSSKPLQAQSLEDRQQFASANSNLSQSSQVSGSNHFTLKSHEVIPEERGFTGEYYGEQSQFQSIGENDLYSTSKSRSTSTSESTSSRNELSSENYWDGSPLGMSKPVADDHIRDWIPLSTVDTDVDERLISEATTPHFQTHPTHVYKSALMRGSNSIFPVAPVLVGSESWQRTVGNHGILPFAFCPAGPPVTFVTMLPAYNLTEIEASSNHSERGGEFKNQQNGLLDHLNSVKNLDHPEALNTGTTIQNVATTEGFGNFKTDMLNSDFANHWQNLQYGRFCQNAQQQWPSLYPSFFGQPVYLQGYFPGDRPERPRNRNLFTTLMTYNSPFIPMSPLKPDSNGPYQHYADEIHTYRAGTEMYLPNPKFSFQNRESTNSRHYRGNYNYPKKDFSIDGEGRWNMNSKPQYTGRGQGLNRVDKPNMRTDRGPNSRRSNRQNWGSRKRDSFPSSYYQNGSIGPSNYINSSYSNVADGMYPLPVYPNGLYPSGVDEASHVDESSPGSVNEQGCYQGDSGHSSPDLSSSPKLPSVG